MYVHVATEELKAAGFISMTDPFKLGEKVVV